MKKIYVILGMFLVISLILVSTIVAMNIDFFYNPNCGHCQQVKPLIQSLNSEYNSDYYRWNFLDVTQGSYSIEGVPIIKIRTNDCREIELIGSKEIPTRLKCELQEMTTQNCPTYYTETIDGSWFLN